MKSLSIIAVLTLAIALGGCSHKKKGSTEADNSQSEISVPGSLLGKSETADRLTQLSAEWTPWQTAYLNGHLQMDGLPLSPSLRVGMDYDKSISLSVRAPFLGEVASAEINTDSVYIVNRINRTYVAESISGLFDNYSVTVADIQNLLLRRAFLPGKGLLKSSLADIVEMMPSESGSFIILPIASGKLPGFTYGYEISSDNSLTALCVRPDSREDQSVAVAYESLKKGYAINVEYGDSTRVYDATLSFDDVAFNTGAPTKLNLSRKFERLSIGEFIKKIK